MKRSTNQNLALFETYQWLRQQYKDEKKSTREIAKMLGCDHTTVWRWLRKFNITTRKEGFQRGHPRYRGDSFGENCSRWKGGGRWYYAQIAYKRWEEYWHEEIPDGYVIHHIDRDYTNNDICNLALLTKEYHGSLHGKEGGRGNKKYVASVLGGTGTTKDVISYAREFEEYLK